MHREVSSRAFTESLLKLANDRNTHHQVKAKILERMKDWSDMFSKDADLGIMDSAYHTLKRSNPTLQAPSAPQKQGLTESDRQKEEDELQMALKLSLQEEERKKAAPAGSSSQAGPSGQQEQAPAPPAGTTAATVSRVRALFDFVPSEPGELEFKKGDVIAVLESVYKDWWRGSLKGNTGIFPLNYVEKLTDPTPDELQREAQMEAEVFAEIKNVEKLLTLLSASNTGPREEDNEEISKLYHQTLAIRPKLIKLIEKYSQKKDDFTQLNEKFIKARRDYEALLESSMAHPPQHNYHQYAMRPAQGQGYPVGGPGYPNPALQQQQQPPQQQDPNRFYTPAPQGDRPAYATTSPPPNFQQQPQQVAGAPFYVGGAEVPSHAAQAHPQQYPRRDSTPRVPSGGRQPAPISTSPAPAHQYTPYSPQAAQNATLHNQQALPTPQQQQQQQRPQSTYGAQELATSVYDSPIAPQNPAAANFYTQEEAKPAPVPSAPYGHPQQQQYQSYPPPAPEQGPPPVPTGQAPPPPQADVYDSRHNLPSQAAPPPPAEPQYKPYTPGPSHDAPSAPSPVDYYRQGSGY